MLKLSNPIRVLMVGVSNPPSTFLARQILILESLGVKVVCFPEVKGRSYIVNLLTYLGTFVHLPRKPYGLFHDVDLIHFQWPGHLLIYYPLARWAKKPVLVSLRGRQINILPYLPHSSGYIKRLRATLPLCNAYHCVSENIMCEAQNFGLDPQRAYVIHPAVDTTFFSPSLEAKIDKPIRLLMVGALIWRKGYEYALLVMKQLIEEGLNVHLTIAGDGNEREQVEFTIKDLGLTDYVHLAGTIKPSEVLKLLHKSHLFLHTSLSEGVANSVLEAMSCSLPVVAFSAGGMNEVIDHEVDGFLVQPRNVESFARYVSDLVRHSELRQKIGGAARAKIQTKFELRDQGEKFLSLYMRLLE